MKLRSVLHTTIRAAVIVIIATVAVYGIGATTASASSESNISIPSISVNAPIVPVYVRDFGGGLVTWDVSALQMTVGYMSGLPWFGENGNVVLGGHSELARGQSDIFYDLDKVSVGDEIIVQANGQQYVYQVTELRNVHVNDLSILRASNHERLTIMTCDPNTFVAANGEYTHRTVVIAELVG